MFLLAAILSLVVCIQATHLRVHHRVLQPGASYALRGSLDTETGALVNDAGVLALGQDIADDALYQIALERGADAGPDDWLVSSVKAVSQIIDLYLILNTFAPVPSTSCRLGLYYLASVTRP